VKLTGALEAQMTCKNLCYRYRGTKDRRSSYYAQGYKRCQVCEIFISWSGSKCPCCQHTLRTRPRTRKKKQVNLVNPDLNSPLGN